MKDKTWLWRFDPGNCWAPYYGTIDAPDRETARVNMLRLIRHHMTAARTDAMMTPITGTPRA